jgi:16S rRNA processing protein RimM
VLAALRRARGLKGELFAETMGSLPERFTPGLEVTLFRGEESREAEVENSRDQNGRLVLKLRGVDNRSQAEELQGWEVRIPESQRPPAPSGQHYLSDLIGYQVVSRDERSIGIVVGWADYGGPALLEVRSGSSEILVPLVPEICVDVDASGRRITVELPEGLEELNRR